MSLYFISYRTICQLGSFEYHDDNRKSEKCGRKTFSTSLLLNLTLIVVFTFSRKAQNILIGKAVEKVEDDELMSQEIFLLKIFWLFL